MKRFLKPITLMIVIIMMAGMVSTGVLAENVLVVGPDDRGTIIIHKYDQETWTGGSAGDGTEITVPTTAKGLNGVTFEAYKLDDIEPPVQNVQNYVRTNTLEPIVKVTQKNLLYGGDGTAVFDDLDMGTYLIVEVASGGVISVIDPFLVKLPMTNAAGDGLMLTVHAYPKNTMLYINKTIVGGSNNGSTKPANIGDTVTWSIKPALPADIGSMDMDTGHYYITDTLDSRLNYGSVTVKLGETTLTGGTDYTLSVPSVTNDNELRIAFDTAAGIENLAAAHEDSETLEILVTTTVGATAAYDLDTGITNSAELHYKNDRNSTEITVDPPTVPEIVLTGLSLVKYDKDDTTEYLPGAEFDLYWSETGAEGSFGKVGNTQITDANGLIYWKLDATVENGLGANGIGYGHFYVLETKAPTGYELLGKISDAIPLDSGNPNGTWKLENTQRSSDFNLPTTGGMGTILYTIIGLALIGGAAAILIASRKKKKADESK